MTLVILTVTAVTVALHAAAIPLAALAPLVWAAAQVAVVTLLGRRHRVPPAATVADRALQDAA